MNITIRSIEARSLNIEWMQGFETEVTRQDNISQYHYWVILKDERKKIVIGKGWFSPLEGGYMEEPTTRSENLRSHKKCLEGFGWGIEKRKRCLSDSSVRNDWTLLCLQCVFMYTIDIHPRRAETHPKLPAINIFARQPQQGSPSLAPTNSLT